MFKPVLVTLIATLALTHAFASDVDYSPETAPTQMKAVNNVRPSSNRILSRVSPQFGGNVSSLVGDGDTGKSKGGFNTGATIDIGHSDFVFETGLLFTSEGAKYDNSGYDQVNLGYFAIPLAGKYYFNGAQANTPYLKLGALPKILVLNQADRRYRYTGDYYDYEGTTTDTITNVNTLVLDAMLGVGGKFQLGSHYDIMVEGVYTRGLTSISTDHNIYDSTFALNVGFGFQL